MRGVVAQAVVLASSGLLSFGSITLIILLLISDNGRRKGLGYAIGYAGSYSLIGLGVTLFGYRPAEPGDHGRGSFLPVLLLVLGSLLLILAVRNWRRPSTDGASPRFTRIVDKVTPLGAIGFGALVSVVNFKNLALFLSAQSVVVLSELPISRKLLISPLVALVFCLSVIVPVLISLILPRRSTSLLGSIKDTITRHSRKVGIWIPVVFGLLLILKGTTDLT